MRSITLMLFMAIIFAACTSTDRKTDKDITPKTGIVNRNGVAISYRACGYADTTLLFIHGWAINKEYWNKQFDYFCPRFKVVAIDLPGFGESGKMKDGWNFDEYTADVKAVIDELKLKNVVLFGHSMSGDIILNADLVYPKALAGIVGVDNLSIPTGAYSKDVVAQLDTFFIMANAHFDSTVGGYMRSQLFEPNSDTVVIDRVMNDIYHGDSAASLQVMKSMADISQQEQVRMGKLTHRLYLINRKTIGTSLDSLNKYCKNGATAIWLDSAKTHYPMIEQPEEFNKAIERVMSQIKK